MHPSRTVCSSTGPGQRRNENALQAVLHRGRGRCEAKHIRVLKQCHGSHNIQIHARTGVARPTAAFSDIDKATSTHPQFCRPASAPAVSSPNARQL